MLSGGVAPRHNGGDMKHLEVEYVIGGGRYGRFNVIYLRWSMMH